MKVGDWFVPRVPLSFVIEHIKSIKGVEISYDSFIVRSDLTFNIRKNFGTTLKSFESSLGNGRRKATIGDFRKMMKKVLDS